MPILNMDLLEKKTLICWFSFTNEYFSVLGENTPKVVPFYLLLYAFFKISSQRMVWIHCYLIFMFVGVKYLILYMFMIILSTLTLSTTFSSEFLWEKVLPRSSNVCLLWSFSTWLVELLIKISAVPDWAHVYMKRGWNLVQFFKAQGQRAAGHTRSVQLAELFPLLLLLSSLLRGH